MERAATDGWPPGGSHFVILKAWGFRFRNDRECGVEVPKIPILVRRGGQGWGAHHFKIIQSTRHLDERRHVQRCVTESASSPAREQAPGLPVSELQEPPPLNRPLSGRPGQRGAQFPG